MQDIVAEQDGISLSAGYATDEPVIMALTVAAERYPRYGYKGFSGRFAGRATHGTISAFTGFTSC